LQAITLTSNSHWFFKFYLWKIKLINFKTSDFCKELRIPIFLLVQSSKFNNFLWVCWFLCKNLSNFVYPVWNLHYPYCHNVHFLQKTSPINFSYNDFIGNKVCDDVLNHKECCFDGGDCSFHHDCISNCPYETTSQGDGVCNANLNIQECCFDAGDCLTDNG
jgi:hypothetical protein